jgi:hypothetical protein
VRVAQELFNITCKALEDFRVTFQRLRTLCLYTFVNPPALSSIFQSP